MDNAETFDTTSVELAYGKTKIKLAVPTKNLAGVLHSTEPTLPPSDEEEIERALREPIGSPGLEDLAKPGTKVVIMASDITRPSPSKKLLPPLLSRLRAAGVRDEDVTVMFGMGIHRNHTEDEKRTLVGDAVYESVKCVDSTEAGDFVLVGTTSRGTPVEVCRMVVDCDLLIGTGNVEYHYFVGYSGGVKAVLPGACSKRTVEANHSMQLLPGAEAGSYEGNPVRQDIEEAGAMIGMDFILNVVLDEKKRIVKAVAGHPTEAHAVARAAVDEIYGVKIPEKADIVVASAGGFPKDVNLYQAQKALENAGRAVRDGGTVILTARCEEGLGEDTFERYMTGMELDEIIESIRKQFVLGGHKAAAIARVIKRATVTLVSAMDPELVRQCKMVPAVTLDYAFAAAMARHGEEARVLVMPYSGSTVPR